jgi:hypothetical protein
MMDVVDAQSAAAAFAGLQKYPTRETTVLGIT